MYMLQSDHHNKLSYPRAFPDLPNSLKEVLFSPKCLCLCLSQEIYNLHLIMCLQVSGSLQHPAQGLLIVGHPSGHIVNGCLASWPHGREDGEAAVQVDFHVHPDHRGATFTYSYETHILSLGYLSPLPALSHVLCHNLTI